MHQKRSIHIDGSFDEAPEAPNGTGVYRRSSEASECQSRLRNQLDMAYREMAADEARENEALEWSEGLVEIIGGEAW